MSDEYSVHGRFLAGKLDDRGYLDKMAYMAARCGICGCKMIPSAEGDPDDPRLDCGGNCLDCYMITTCADCGMTYDFGVVGTTMIGSGHVCEKRCLCSCGHDHQHCPCECEGTCCRYEPCEICSGGDSDA